MGTYWMILDLEKMLEAYALHAKAGLPRPRIEVSYSLGP